MIKKLYLIFFGVLTFAMLACSDDSVTGSSDVELSSSSVDMPSSSSVELESSSSSSENSSILCKTSGNWGYDGCIVKKPSGRGDLWSNGDSVVSTKAYADDTSKFGKRAGEWFFEKDSVDEKQAEIFPVKSLREAFPVTLSTFQFFALKKKSFIVKSLSSSRTAPPALTISSLRRNVNFCTETVAYGCSSVPER